MKILWLKTGPLHPLDTGGKIRTYNMLKGLKERHTIDYLSLCDPATPDSVKSQAQEYSHRQHWVPHRVRRTFPFRHMSAAWNLACSAQALVISSYRSSKAEALIRQISSAYDLLICDFLNSAVNLPSRIATPTLLFQHNVEAQIWERMAQNAQNRLRRWYFKKQWQRLRDFEAATCRRFSGVVSVSEEDCQTMRHAYAASNVLGSVPTGVDTGYFQPSSRERRPYSLVFLGSMDWMPNIDGAQWLVQEVLPLVRNRHPQLHLTIAGRNPTPAVRVLAEKESGIEVTGTVDDVRPYLAKAQAMVVPLRAGGGTRIKIFEGMATGIPVVSTPIGAEGLPLRNGIDAVIAEDAQSFADAINQLFESPQLGQRIGAEGARMVREQFGWEKAVDRFEGYCEHLIRKK